MMELLRSDSPHPSLIIGAVTVGVVALVLLAAITHYVPFLSGSSGQVVRADFLAAFISLAQSSASSVGAGAPNRVTMSRWLGTT